MGQASLNDGSRACVGLIRLGVGERVACPVNEGEVDPGEFFEQGADGLARGAGATAAWGAVEFVFDNGRGMGRHDLTVWIDAKLSGK